VDVVESFPVDGEVAFAGLFCGVMLRLLRRGRKSYGLWGIYWTNGGGSRTVFGASGQLGGCVHAG